MPDRVLSRHEIVGRILSSGLMPNYTADNDEAAFGVAAATLAGGCGVLEFLNRGPEAASVFARLAARVRMELPGLLLGGGTVTEQATAAQYINAGAQFVVGPNFNPEVARVCNRRGIPYVPGCGTASEISDALASGADIVKVFPGPSLGGPGVVKAVLGPLPHALLMPSGGVGIEEAELREWFGAGVACVSVGGDLFPREAIKRGEWAAIEASVRTVVDRLARIRGEVPTAVR